MAEQRVALAMISGDNTTPADWERILQSTKGAVDGVFISYNGEDISAFFKMVADAKVATEMADVQLLVAVRDWDDDFAAARNHSFSLVPENFDWILWLDTDDEFVGAEKVKRSLANLDAGVGSVYLTYRYVINQDGSTVVTQWRERFLRKAANPAWRRRVHEVCPVDAGWRQVRTSDVWVDHHREDQFDSRTRERNRRILGKAVKEDPAEPAYLWYLGHEVFGEFQARMRAGLRVEAGRALDLALKTYQEYIRRFGNEVTSDDPYIAMCRIAECLRIKGRWDSAVDMDLQAMKARPHRPEAYIGIADSYLATKRWLSVLDWCDLAIERFEKMDEQIDAVEVEALAYAPHVFKAQAFEALNDYEHALIEYRHCDRVAPHINDLAPKIAELEATIKRQQQANTYRAQTRGSQPERSIAFVTRPLFEPWHPEIEKEKGSGGAEKCVQEVAKRFAADGWRTVVFGTPGPHRGLYEADGVEYLSSMHDYDPAEKFRVVVGSRTPEVFAPDPQGELRLLWMHDVNVGEKFEAEDLERADRIVGLTNWHARHLGRLYYLDPRKLWVIPNGFEADVFKDWGARAPGRCVYASSPDRGLQNLLELWPHIRERYPFATLDIYYGWAGVNALLEVVPDHPVSFTKGKIEATFQQVQDGSLTWHDRVPRTELAEAYKTADLWLYPTEFMETYCITALEMQAAGVTPLVTDLAALTEVVHDTFRVAGYAGNDDYRRRFMGRLDGIMQADDSIREAWREANRQSTSVRTWDHSYEEWRNLLLAHGVS